MNQNKELLRTRRSIRHFLPELVSNDILKRMIENAIWTPSNRDKQPRWFYILTKWQPQARLLLGNLAKNPVPRPKQPVEEVAIFE